jgi:hypothetical protein
MDFFGPHHLVISCCCTHARTHTRTHAHTHATACYKSEEGWTLVRSKMELRVSERVQIRVSILAVVGQEPMHALEYEVCVYTVVLKYLEPRGTRTPYPIGYSIPSPATEMPRDHTTFVRGTYLVHILASLHPCIHASVA